MAVTPSTDPLYAWDVPGWTIQKGGSAATAGLNLEESPGVGASSLAGGGAAISGLLGQTMAPESAVTAAVTPASATWQGGLVYVPEGGVTTKALVFASTTTGGTHVYGLLLSATTATTATVVAATADLQGAVPAGVGSSWAASTTIAPGFYYLGIAIGVSGPVLWGSPVGVVTNSNANGSAPFPRFVVGTLASSATAPALGTSLTFAAQTTLGGLFMGMY